jgi:MFS family permease
VSYLLWILMGYMLVVAVLVVALGRLGDMMGRVKIYRLGFAVFTIGTILLALDPFDQGTGAIWLIFWRLVQGVGGAMLMANSAAILTDAFPADQRGMAMGTNQVAGIAGSFLGLVVGGVLSESNWRLTFFVSAPIGLLGTLWSYKSLRETAVRAGKDKIKLDWLGNLTFAVGLTALLAGITYGIQPYGGSDMGWSNPWVLAGLIGGVALLALFCFIETRVEQPMFHLGLFKIRAFAMSSIAGLLTAIARGGMQFMLIIWLQGIWLPLHGYKFEDTPLWAGIYLLPLTLGFLVAGPASGWLSDRYGARVFSTTGLLLAAISFGGLLAIPTDFSYGWFALLIFLNGVGFGLFMAPNSTALMNSVPADKRGSAGGMSATFMNGGMVLSMGVFFSLMIAGLSQSLPHTMTQGLAQHGVPQPVAHHIGSLPPVGTLFAAFLGYNPIESLLGPTGVLSHLSPANAHLLIGQQYFPRLISTPFHDGLTIVFGVAIGATLVAALASLLRGKRYYHQESELTGIEDVENAVVSIGETSPGNR